MSKRHAHAVLLVSSTISLEPVATAPNVVILVCCLMKCGAQVAFVVRTVTLSCRSMACAGASEECEPKELQVWMPSIQV